MITFILKEGIMNFFRSKFTGFMTLLSGIITFSLISFIGLAYYNSKIQLEESRNQSSLTVYFNQDIASAEALKKCNSFKNIKGISNIVFISKEDAIRDYYQQKGSSQNVIKMLGYNPLPDAAEITIKIPDMTKKDIQDIIQALLKIEKNIEIVNKANFFEKYSKIIDFILKIFLIISLTITFITILLVMNTIRLSIFSRKQIIETMQLVGAGRFFIQAPFLIEALFQGFVVFIIIYLSNFLFLNFLNEKLQFLKDLGLKNLIFYQYHFILMFIIIMLIHVFGAKIALMRHLRIKFKKF